MDKIFETLESVIKRIFDLLANIFKIFEKNEEGADAEGNA